MDALRRLVLIVLTVGLLSPVGVAHAAVPDAYGFAVWDGAAAINKTPATTTIVELPAGSGKYRVIFPGQGRTNAYAHATAINNGGRWCQVSNWARAGADAWVFVDCFNFGGVRATSKFSVMYASSSLPTAGTGAHAYYVYNPGGVHNMFNSTGAVDAVPTDEAGVGTWMHTFQGMGGVMHKGNLQVTALEWARGVRCKVWAWWIYDPHLQVRVICFDAAGARTDTRWVLSYHEMRKVNGADGGKWAYGTIWWPGTSPPFIDVAETNRNSLGARNTVTYLSTGRYLLTMPLVGDSISNAQVTAYGHLDNRWCALADHWTAVGGEVRVQVACYAGGQYADSGFFVTYAGAG